MMPDFTDLVAAIAAVGEADLDRCGRIIFERNRNFEPGPRADLFVALGLTLIEAAEERGRALDALDPEDAVGGFIEPGRAADALAAALEAGEDAAVLEALEALEALDALDVDEWGADDG